MGNEIKVLKDNAGVTYGFVERGDDAELFSIAFPEIRHSYKKKFIQGAISEGLLRHTGKIIKLGLLILLFP